MPFRGRPRPRGLRRADALSAHAVSYSPNLTTTTPSPKLLSRIKLISRIQSQKIRRQFHQLETSCVRYRFSLVSLAALLGLAWAANVEDELKKLETDRAAAVVKGDVATLEKQTSDDYTLINAYGQMSGKSEMVDAFKSGKTKLTSDELSDMKGRVYGNTAVITGKATVKGTMGGKDVDGQILFTRVYVKKGGR